jgi:hypothetical protein
MKRILLFILAFVWFNSQAQKAFEGTLFIEVLSADSSEIPKMNFEVKLKGSMARMNIHSENIDDYSIIINYETGESVMLKTHNGEKIAVRGVKPLAEVGSFSAENAKLKKVAGYNCRKGKITTKEGIVQKCIIQQHSIAQRNFSARIRMCLDSSWSFIY